CPEWKRSCAAMAHGSCWCGWATSSCAGSPPGPPRASARGSPPPPSRSAAPTRALLGLPDIDKGERWDAQGTKLEEVLAGVDVAYLDGTFFADGEVPGRSMAEIPHPFVRETIARLPALAAA